MDGVRPVRRGKVWLVGAGPGSADLLTLRAYRLLERARVIAYDELVSTEVLSIAPANAERIPVGRRARGNRHHDARIHPLVVERALGGQDVVRIKGGDPLVFGRGGEEAEELGRAGIPFEVVPGVSAALAAAAEANIALTHRDCASRVTLATAHSASGPALEAHSGGAGETIVFYMALGRVDATCASLVSAGRRSDTPAALVSRASLPDARVVVGTLADLGEKVRGAAIEAPAILVVGEVVARRVVSPALAWVGLRAATG